MTVGELTAFLKDVPDDTQFWVHIDHPTQGHDVYHPEPDDLMHRDQLNEFCILVPFDEKGVWEAVHGPHAVWPY